MVTSQLYVDVTALCHYGPEHKDDKKRKLVFTTMWLAWLPLSIHRGNSVNTIRSHLLINLQCWVHWFVDYITSTSCLDNRAQGGPVTSIISYCACCILSELRKKYFHRLYRFLVGMFPWPYQIIKKICILMFCNYKYHDYNC